MMIKLFRQDNWSPTASRVVIEAGRANRQYLRDLWSHRELFAILVWRDILVRYKQTVIGVAWSVVRPLVTVVVFTIVFGKLAKMPSDGVPYPVLVFAAMLPWQFFSNTLSEGGVSLLNNATLISKIYFPRLIIPTTSMIVSLVDFLISFAIFVGLMFFYHHMPTWRIVFLPLFLALAAATALGITYFISALTVKYRDFRHVLPFIVQIGLYLSPVGFSSSIVPDQWRLLYSLNPMVGVIDGFRWAIIGGIDMKWAAIGLSCIVAASALIAGLATFLRMDREFADVI